MLTSLSGHALIIHESDEKANPYATPPTTTGPRPILRGIWRMLTVFTIHDVSYLLAVTFSAACLILVVTAILSFLPYANSSFPSSTVLYRIEAVLSAFGATAFFVGSLFAFSEAVNVNRKGCFGWRLQRISNNLEGLGGDDGTKGADITLLVPDGSCSHHHDSYKVVAGHPQSWSQVSLAAQALSTLHTRNFLYYTPSLTKEKRKSRPTEPKVSAHPSAKTRSKNPGSGSLHGTRSARTYGTTTASSQLPCSRVVRASTPPWHGLLWRRRSRADRLHRGSAFRRSSLPLASRSRVVCRWWRRSGVGSGRVGG